ncbi:hypothetical protein [Chitinophaga sp. RAB17]|uniref:hypothetical protein n=1 Tax=Chitinophaga sp. RAB17 TaxID=3233049 RepID=UPI003F911A1C
MKKAKIALTAVAVLAVVGGALAFKASIAKTFYQSTVAGGPCSYSTSLSLITTTLTAPGAFTTELSLQRDLVNPCPVITVKANN